MRSSIVILALMLGVILANGAARSAAASSDETYKLNIPSQSLNDALQAFALASRHKLFYQADIVHGKVNAPLIGEYTTEEAMQKILAGTDLSYEISADGVVFVRAKNASALTGTAESPADVHLATGEAAQEPPKGAASADSGPADKLEEVVVTAQKRKERLKDVPIAISVLQGADLDKSTAEGINEQIGRFPGVSQTVDFQSHGSQFTVRGVTAAGPLFSGSSPVAYYLDGIPFGLTVSSITPDANAYDMDRVEVLRGPQGTLYGASALNGVIRVLTQDADLSKFEFKARTSLSGTEDGGESYRGDLVVNAPIVEGKLGARAVVGYQNLGGWIDKPNDKDANDAEIRTFRLKIDAQPNDALSVGASAWLSRADFRSPSSGVDGLHSSNTLQEPLSVDYDVLGLKVGYDFNAFLVTSTSSYLRYENGGNLDLAAFQLPFAATLFTGLDAKVYSEELVLTSTRQSIWRWSLGGIYRDSDDRSNQSLSLVGGPTIDYGYADTHSKSSAIFGELTRIFMNGKVELTGGLRYFEDRQASTQVDVPNGITLPQRLHFNATTPRVVLTWHSSSQATVYASYSQGFRSGFGQNLQTLESDPNQPSVEPDKLSNYELGIKGDLMNGRFSYEAATFFIDWKGVQQPLSLAAADNGLPFAATINGQSASGMGAEFAATIKPLDHIELGFGAGWNGLTIDHDVTAVVAGDPGQPPRTVIQFAKGVRLNGSPEYAANASADYVFPIAASLAGRLSLSGNYISQLEWRQPEVHTKGGAMLTARAAFSVTSADHWAASLFVDNITNEQDTPLRVLPANFDPRMRPRTVGVQVEFRL